MSEKPQKRLVSKRRYVWILVKNSILPLIVLGEVLYCTGGFIGIYSDFRMDRASWHDYVAPGIFMVLTGCALWAVTVKLRAKVAHDISSVTPITRHTTNFLPPEQSLVRASDAPPSHQQAELLRASQHGNETPAEELLRATTNKQGD